MARKPLPLDLPDLDLGRNPGPQPLPEASRAANQAAAARAAEMPLRAGGTGVPPAAQMGPPVPTAVRHPPTLDTSRLPPALSAGPDVASYNTTPEGQATQRQFHEARAQQAGIGSKYNAGAGPVGNNATASAAAEAEAAARQQAQRAQWAKAGVGTAPPAGAPAAAPGAAAPAAQGGRISRAVSGAKDALRSGGAFLGKAGVVGGVGYGAYETAAGLQEGDYQRAGLGAADAAASASLVTPAAPIGATWLGARGAHALLQAGVDKFNLGDAIGGTINQIGLNTGLWGTDDSNYLRLQAEHRAKNPQPSAQAQARTQPSPQTQDNNPYAAANQAKLDAFAAEERARVAAGQAPTYDPNQARLDLGYGAIGDRRALTNEQAAAMNPAGRITVARGPGGTMEFSGGNVQGQVSYQDPSGQALPGGGLRGRGFSNFDVAPAGSNVAMGPGGYAFATSGSGLRGGADGAQGSAGGGAQGGYTAGGIDVRGLTPSQAARYADQVRSAQAFNQNVARISGAVQNSRAAERAQREREAVMSALMTPLTGDPKRDLTASQRGAMVQMLGQDSQERQASARDATTLRSAEISADASRYGADASRYGADQRLRGDMFTAARAEAAAARQVAKDEAAAAKDRRDYETGRRDKALERLDKLFETEATIDGKVDHGQLAALRNGAQAFLGSAIEAARKRGDVATAQALETAGLSALTEDPQLMRQYFAAMRADRAARSGWMPGERYVGSDNPGGRVVTGVEPGFFADTARFSDGSTVNANRLRYRDGGFFSGINPWADPTDEFAAIDPNNYLRKAPR